MKKLLLSTIALSLCFAVSAQNAKTKRLPITGAPVNKAVPVRKAILPETSFYLNPNPVVAPVQSRVAWSEVQLGTSTYDLQANYGGCGNRVKTWSDNTISAVWTYSADLAGTYPDRGTGYNYYNGSTWGPNPSSRIESVRTGFPNITGSNINEEAVICHQPNAYSVVRPAKGTGSWTEAALPYPSAIASTWNRITCGGANGRTLHVIGNTGAAGGGQLEEIFYWRSPDFGATWDIVEYKIPVLDSNNVIDPTADGYDIDARGDVIAIVAGGFANDLILAKSTDNGTTWTKRVIYAFPIPLYDNVSITDIDGDGVADTCDAADSGPSVVIDNNNQAHVWCGATRILNDAGTVNYFPATDGLFYWNESYPDGDLMNHLVDQIKDLNSNGTIDLLANDPGAYQCSLTGMPSGGVCGTGKLFVVYTSLVEGTSNGADQTYRDVFYSESTDGGNTWLANSINLTMSDFDEEAFTNMNNNIDGRLDVIFYRDGEPGTSLGADADPITTGFTMYASHVVDCSVGISENIKTSEGVSFYPNPASDFTRMNISLNNAALVKVEIVNLLGATVSSLQNNLPAGDNSLTLDVSKLQNGVYNIKTTVGINVFTNTIVKN